ncbi:MAG: FAD-dependent oxidoreductase, partial [Anaerolineae bacterium]|nr:FAD-dependent oxidoreductase [Anaerolineae bacterium]
MQYDAIVIGAGQAGPSLAAFFAGEGQRVALVEGAQLGGSCVNYGCTPTKTMRASARNAYQARRSAEFGIHTGEVHVDLAAVMDRKNRVVDNSRTGLTQWLESVDNLDILRGWASFDGKEGDLFRVRIGEETHTAERVYLNTGTRARILPVDGLDDVDYLDNVSLMDLRELPQQLIILGGSYIGLEMGQIFRRLGSEVTIIEYSPRVASREDEDVTQEVERIFRAEGIRLLTGHKASHVSQTGNTITVTAEAVEGGKSV